MSQDTKGKSSGAEPKANSGQMIDSTIQEHGEEMTDVLRVPVRKTSKSLEERLRFEHLIADISARFVKVEPDRLDGEIQKAMKSLLDFFQVDRCNLLKTLPGRTSWIITHVASSDQVPPLPVGIELPRAIHPWAYEHITAGHVLRFTCPEETPPEAEVDRKAWREWGIRSNLVIPIVLGESVDRGIALNAVVKERDWPEEYIPRLRLLGGIFVNALERRDAETALRESEERMELAAASAEAGVWVLNMDTGSVWATDKLRQLFRFAPDEELNFESFMNRIHPDDRDRVRENVRQSRDGREMLQVEYRIVHPEGNVCWIVARGRSYPGETGRPGRIMGVTIDVTERREMEERLRQNLEEIERLKDNLEEENIFLREDLSREKGFGDIVGKSKSLNYVLFRAGQVAPTDATVLIIGETGTGKGIIANAIHGLSNRKDRTMVTVNCAALPANLIESELFGREKGAFTGAHTRQAGRFEVANGGTLFLDEIGELPLELQAKLLRVLQEGEFERLGSTKTINVDVRVIVSTNRDLKEAVRTGKFRKDLFYRLNVFPVTIPPLRQRIEDIPDLVRFFVEKYSRKFGKQIVTVPKGVMKSLQAYDWPGNVRELQHVIERAVITSEDSILRLAEGLESIPETRVPVTEMKDLAAAEREHILNILKKTVWKIEGPKGAASILKLHPSTLRLRMKKLGIKRPN